MKLSKIEQVDTLYTRLAAQYQKCRASWDLDRDLYYMNHYRLQEGEKKADREMIQVNKATNTVDITYSILTLHPPKITAQPISPSAKADKNADKVEKFIAGALYINNLRFQEDQTAKAIFDQVCYGRGAMFSGWDPELEGEAEEYSELPVIVKYVNHRNLYCLRGGNRRDIAQMYCLNRTAEDLEAEFDKPIYHSSPRSKANRATEDEQLVYKEVWWYKGREVWNCMAAGGTWLKPPKKMPYYTRLPYTEFIGRGTTSEDLHLQMLSILYPLREAIQVMERWLNIGTETVLHFADPPVVYDQRLGDINMDTGASIPVHLSPGESLRDKIQSYPPSDAAPGVYKFIQIAEQMVEEGGFSRWAYANVNPESGPVVQGMNANDRIRLTVYQRNAELAISAVIQKMLDCAYAFARTDAEGKPNKDKPSARKLQVFSEGERSAIALSPQDLKGWLVTANLSTKLPTDEARDIAIAANAVQSGLPISQYTILQRFLGIQQPAEEQRRIMVDMWKRDPDVIQMAKVRAMAETGQELTEAMLPGLGEPSSGAPNEPKPVLPPTTAVHPQQFQEMPPESLQKRQTGEPALRGITPGAPTGPVP